MADFNPKTRRSQVNMGALVRALAATPPVASSGPTGTRVWLLDDDMQPTQCMAAVRWIMTENPFDYRILQVDGAGDAIVLLNPSEEEN